MAGSGFVVEQTCEHNYTIIAFDDNMHWTKCSKCNEKMKNSEDSHTFGEMTNNGKTTGTHSATCTFEGCEYKITEAHIFNSNGNCTECEAIQDVGCEHDYTVVGNDDTYHWTKCSICGEIKENTKQEHELDTCENNYDSTHSARCIYDECEYESINIHEFGTDGRCVECDAMACDEGEHNFSAFKWDNDIHYLSCIWCEVAKLDSIQKHTLGKWEVNAEGMQQAECTNNECGYVVAKKLLGDLNFDNEVDITDLVILKRHIIAGSKTEWILAENVLQLADLDENGDVDITDVVRLKRTILESM